jgi:hypothetical protein
MISNIDGEKKQLEITKKQYISHPGNLPKTYSERDIRGLCLCLNPSGQKWTWEYWSKLIWCLRNVSDSYKLGLRGLAHSLSQENPLYNASNTDELYDTKKISDSENPMLGIGSLIMWSKEANPEQYVIWRQSIRQAEAVKEFSIKKDEDIALLLSLFTDDDVAEYFVKTQGDNYHISLDNEIYHWEKNYWIKTDEGVISIILSEVIYKAMKIKLDIHHDKNKDAKEYMLLFKKINSLRNCKPRMGYLKAIIEKLKRKQFLQGGIGGSTDTFDMNPDLLCFTNGV